MTEPTVNELHFGPSPVAVLVLRDTQEPVLAERVVPGAPFLRDRLPECYPRPESASPDLHHNLTAAAPGGWRLCQMTGEPPATTRDQ